MTESEDKDKLKGGKILVDKVVGKEINTRAAQQADLIEGKKKKQQIEFDALLRRVASLQRPAVVMEPRGPDPLYDQRHREGLGQFQFSHMYVRYPEDHVARGASKIYSGQGASRDAPQLHQLFMDSIKHPKLRALYTKN